MKRMAKGFVATRSDAVPDLGDHLSDGCAYR